MLVGVPTEVKNHEYRVAITPAGVHEFARHGHYGAGRDGGGAGLVDHRSTSSPQQGRPYFPVKEDIWARLSCPEDQGADRRRIRANP